MKLNVTQLRRIIREEVAKHLKEAAPRLGTDPRKVWAYEDFPLTNKAAGVMLNKFPEEDESIAFGFYEPLLQFFRSMNGDIGILQMAARGKNLEGKFQDFKQGFAQAFMKHPDAFANLSLAPNAKVLLHAVKKFRQEKEKASSEMSKPKKLTPDEQQLQQVYGGDRNERPWGLGT